MAEGPRPMPAFVRHIPNALSLSRILFVPVVCVLWLSALPHRAEWCAALFGVATLTDLFDGLIARRLGVVSRFGAFLDPVTDKLLVCSCLVLLSSTYTSLAFMACTITVVAREIAVSALREWMAQCGKRDDVQVGTLGKYKTASQLAAIWLFFALPAIPAESALGPVVSGVADALLYTSTALSSLSMVLYFRAARDSLFG
ncbi:CDP-alcohol phosphatidyltransferase-domain-containing protein [Pavlovales sp. CCMP2436]|nr:CDP-alcohol phosphatidyltransferase-domain-containing protein [Pavlovales sp. CCMP2436]